jgi:hypothetical protein
MHKLIIEESPCPNLLSSLSRIGVVERFSAKGSHISVWISSVGFGGMPDGEQTTSTTEAIVIEELFEVPLPLSGLTQMTGFCVELVSNWNWNIGE